MKMGYNGMKSNQMILAAFSVGLLLVLRGYMSLGIREFQTKKKWKRYKEEVPAIDRWFFWTAPRAIGDRYSKAEKKVIRYSAAARVYRAVNFVLHIVLLVELTVIFCNALGFAGEAFLNGTCMLYFCMVFLTFVCLAVMEYAMNSRYHRSRYRRRKSG